MILHTDNGWSINDAGDGYLFIARLGRPGEIVIKAEDEGYVIDVYPEGDPGGPDSTLSVFYSDLEMLPDA